jgi:hypothetical protein
MRCEMFGLDARFGLGVDDSGKLELAMADYDAFIVQIRTAFAQFISA